MALSLETLDVLYELPRHPGITQQIVDAVGEAITELATTYTLLEQLAARKTDAKLGAAVRKIAKADYPAAPGGPCLVCCYDEIETKEDGWEIVCVGWGVSSIYYEYVADAVGCWYSTPDEALAAAGLMEAE